MTRPTLDRRSFVQTAVALGATTALAGCGGSGDNGSGDDGSGDDGSGDGGGDDNGSDDGEFLAEEPDYDGWFDDVDNYEGTVDRTGSDGVTIQVGSGSGLSFGPAAVAVSPGTTVVWEWTGEGGDHNVAAEDGAFTSETVSEAGHTFEYTFEESGVHEYVCTPHEAVGMKGAVYVE
ncbi:halocyanin domain-containing protein [Halorubrum sp. DTA46]|uniref:halocyanin domain-containing protein n=1 Tax=Halorubrum sp. DTA46 TaxID=3402162 RepID=UPI003AACC2F6